MPDTPIDQSASIQSIRLKIPTGTVPIPPAGFGQLHSPSSGTLALRLPDGGVVEVGGGSGGTPAVLAGTGGVVEALSNPFTGAGITLTPNAGETIFFNGPVVGPDADTPFGVQVVTVEINSAELLALHLTGKLLVAEPSDPGRMVWPVGIATRYNPATTPYTQSGGAGAALQFSQNGADGWTSISLDAACAGGDNSRRWNVGNPTGAAFMGMTHRGLSVLSDAALVGGDGSLTVAVALVVF